MSNNVAMTSAILLQRQLDIVLKSHGHAGASRPESQKFAELANMPFGIPFVPTPVARVAAPFKVKPKPSKDRRSRDQTDDPSEETPAERKQARQNSHRVDVTV